jgi:Zn-dependent protease
MRNSLAIGRIAGISIFIHWTFPIIILWIVFINVRQGNGTEQISRSIAFVLVLFFCVTLHELGHALAARRFDIQTKDITLLPIGGVARLENMPENPLIELLVAFAGPAVNLLIFAVLYFPFVVGDVPFSFTGPVRITGENFIYNLALLTCG